jgi:3'-5' exonuclease
MVKTLVLDIETIGENWNDLDHMTQESLLAWVKSESKNETEKEKMSQAMKDGLGFSPLTGEIVAIGIYDYERQKGAVYYSTNSAGELHKTTEEDDIKYEPTDEPKMLCKFWELAQSYDTFVTFNGNQFDMPYLMVRSAVHSVRPTQNLMTNRYLSLQRGGVRHIDLLDQLSFYGAMRRRGSLHLWTRAFGIKSPKSEDVNGHQVSQLFHDGRYLDIAKYNAADIKATSELYTKWLSFLKF